MQSDTQSDPQPTETHHRRTLSELLARIDTLLTEHPPSGRADWDTIHFELSAHLATLTSNQSRCFWCDAALPLPLEDQFVGVRLEECKGNEHVKRAIEVALAGDHTITLLACGDLDEAVKLGAIAKRYGAKITVHTVCPCGYHGDEQRTCTCTEEAIFHHRRAIPPSDLTAQVPRLPYERLTAQRLGERDEQLLARVAQAKAAAPIIIDPQTRLPSLEAASHNLLRAVQRQFAFTHTKYTALLWLAATIARLAGSVHVAPAHLAEAVQYRRQ